MAANGIVGAKQKKLILCFYKPMSPSELNKQCAFEKNYISYCLRVLTQHKLVQCLIPSVKTGRIYGLSPTGIALRKELILSEEKDDHIPNDYLIPNRINWSLYGWVLAGKGRKEYLKIMNNYSMIKDGTFKASHIFTRFRYEGIKSTPRTEVYRAIKHFVKKGLLMRIPEGKRGVRYKLTETGINVSVLLSV